MIVCLGISSQHQACPKRLDCARYQALRELAGIRADVRRFFHLCQTEAHERFEPAPRAQQV